LSHLILPGTGATSAPLINFCQLTTPMNGEWSGAVAIIRNETYRDIEAREQLLDRVLGPSRFEKTAERLREGRSPAAGLSLVAEQDGKVVGTVRLWHVCAGHERPALLLGPLAVEEDCRNRGIGSALMRRAVGVAGRRGHDALLLVGDAPYYQRFGFSAAKTGALWLPGPFERQRLLGCELHAGALDGKRGLISATGRSAQKPTFTTRVAGPAGNPAARQAA
jgi:predicted N-acetyltransferase YhbS